MSGGSGPAVVVGAGLMGRWHGHAVTRSGGRVVAVVDPDPERASALAGQFDGARALGALADVPTDAGVAVAHLCTPTPTHGALVVECLERGWHVLVEKPFADSAPATETLLEEAGSRGLLACPVHQFPFQDGVRRIRDALETLGPVRHVEMAVCSAGAQGLDGKARDRVALEILPHGLSLLAGLAPWAVEAGAPWQAVHPAAGEVWAMAAHAGATVSLLVSMSGRPTRNTLWVVGEGGSAQADLFHGFAVVEPGDVSRGRKIARPFTVSATTLAAAGRNLARRALASEPAYPGLKELVEAFHVAAREGRAPPISPDETIRIARTWDRLRDAAGPPEEA